MAINKSLVSAQRVRAYEAGSAPDVPTAARSLKGRASCDRASSQSLSRHVNFLFLLGLIASLVMSPTDEFTIE